MPLLNSRHPGSTRRVADRCRLASSSCAVVILLTLCQLTSPLAAQSFQPSARIRRPVAVERIDNRLYIANQRTGSLSVIDCDQGTVIDEMELGQSIVDLAFAAERLWAIDYLGDELIEISLPQGRQVRHHVPASPVSICVSPHQQLLTIACLWPRRLLLFSLAEQTAEACATEVALPFAPREQLFLDEHTLVVGDAYAGRLAVVDVRQRAIVAVHDTGGQNIRGLTMRGQRLQITMQRLNSFRPTTHEDIFWGGVLQNLLVEVTAGQLRNKDLDWSAAEQNYYLGRPNEAAGDPDAILNLQDGRLIVALAGVHQVAIRPAAQAPFELRPVGARPVDLALDGTGQQVYVACQMDDAIAVVDLEKLQVTERISLGPDVASTTVDLGEALFYDATLSLDGWYSCHSCHTDGHSNELLNDNFGDDSTGAPKRILSLLGVQDTGPWAWNGGAETLEQQVRKSLETTMQAEAIRDKTVAALADYLRSLPPPPRGHVRFAVDHEAAERGSKIFQERGCADCHAAPHFTSADVYDVGIHDETKQTKFNPPSLRGVAHRNSFFHDNRATSLEQVFTETRHPHGEELQEADLKALVEYLKTL